VSRRVWELGLSQTTSDLHYRPSSMIGSSDAKWDDFCTAPVVIRETRSPVGKNETAASGEWQLPLVVHPRERGGGSD
jgi:hypothetical protein